MQRLSLDDLNMICSFVLASGSVKDLAQVYSVSYPTMRSRLDSVIERLRKIVDGNQPDPLNDCLAELIASGRIGVADARRLRELHRAVLEHESRNENGGQS